MSKTFNIIQAINNVTLFKKMKTYQSVEW